MGNLDGWVIEKMYIVDKDGNVLGEVEPYALETIEDEVCENNKDDKQEET